MAATTIEIPAAHAQALRASLLAAGDARRPVAVQRLLAQLDGFDGSRALRLSGPRALLWNALYDALCAAAEALAEECNEHWRAGGVDGLRARVAEVGERLELLAALGPPPRG